ncbi:MAG: Gfo/Idh/MocA family oxidoreductase [Actinobacteria bacterium]|nr:Gfo/Idh/MocA family oxidoreductase [Actinomycetota bacterium]
MSGSSAAVIGLGYWGPNVLRNIMEIDKFDDVYVHDINDNNLTRNRIKYPRISLTEKYDEILDNDNINCVFICTPPVTHYGLAKEALLKGKNVLIEKPMTVSVKEAEDLIRISEEKSLILMVGHTFEYSPPVEKIKEIIDGGILGDIYFVSMSRINLGIHRKDVSVIWDLATHDFSILFRLIDEMPRKISAVTNSFVKKDLKDVAFINMKYDSGIIANINVSWLSPKKVRETIIVGSKKMLIYDDTMSDEKIKVYDKGVELLKDPDSFGEYQLTYRTGDIYSPVLKSTEPLRIEIEHFLECVSNGTKPRTDGYCGLKVVRAIEAAERSSDKNGEVVEINAG